MVTTSRVTQQQKKEHYENDVIYFDKSEKRKNDIANWLFEDGRGNSNGWLEMTVALNAGNNEDAYRKLLQKIGFLNDFNFRVAYIVRENEARFGNSVIEDMFNRIARKILGGTGYQNYLNYTSKLQQKFPDNVQVKNIEDIVRESKAKEIKKERRKFGRKFYGYNTQNKRELAILIVIRKKNYSQNAYKSVKTGKFVRRKK